MSKEIINSLISAYNRGIDFFDKFIGICPENIWTTNTIGWPAWQHVYHSLACSRFFLEPKDSELPLGKYSAAVVMFDEVPDVIPSCSELQAFLKETVTYTDSIFSLWEDSDLPKVHEGASQRMKQNLTHADVLSRLIGHHFYHFGHCDAALRGSGLKGIF